MSNILTPLYPEKLKITSEFDADAVFVDFEKFCLSRKPYSFCEKGGMWLRKAAISNYWDFLLDLPAKECSNAGRIGMVFCSPKDGFLDLEFTFSNEGPTIQTKMNGFHLCLKSLMEEQGFERVEATIGRTWKKEKFKNWIDRHDNIAHTDGERIIWKHNEIHS